MIQNCSSIYLLLKRRHVNGLARGRLCFGDNCGACPQSGERRTRTWTFVQCRRSSLSWPGPRSIDFPKEAVVMLISEVSEDGLELLQLDRCEVGYTASDLLVFQEGQSGADRFNSEIVVIS